MSCCVPSQAQTATPAPRHAALAEEVRLASRTLDSGLLQTDLSVPGMHCGACMEKIEAALGELPGVEAARVNLSTRRVSVRWRGEPPPLVETLESIGYDGQLSEPDAGDRDGTLSELVWALAVAGFAAMNIMLLSVSVWSGALPATRDLFHGISALIALPALVFSGRIFFRSAWQALRHGQTNMDVPISIGVVLAFGMSLYDTLTHGQHAYFDASTSLLFFLLIGRTLDHLMRERTRTAVRGLARLGARGARIVGTDGTEDYRPLGEIEPGMRILLAAGERVPVDCEVLSGRSEIDYSLVNGESAPRPALPGTRLEAGTLNLNGPLTVTAMAAAKDSFLAEMVRLMEAAEAGRSRYRRIADRASRLYAPVVHLAAFLSFLGWLLLNGDVHQAVTIAVAVLIITCPCALGLAVPMVQVMAARRLFEAGVMVKDGAAMERLTEVDTVVFDKTGTLTLGVPRLANAAAIADRDLALAAAIAAHSLHPLSQAIAAAGRHLTHLAPTLERVEEIAGTGMEALVAGRVYQLGRGDQTGGGTELSCDGRALAQFSFDETLRPDVVAAIAALRRRGLAVEMLSGDTADRVAELAARLGIEQYSAGVRPADKLARITALSQAGRKVLMVGDGLNDAPALAAAHASMAPGSGADIGRNAADFVFLHPSLDAVPLALDISRRAGRLVRQNFVLAIGYNVVALPLAVAGLVTPLIAALAMSLSSILVVANAMRLGRTGPRTRPATAEPTTHTWQLETAE